MNKYRPGEDLNVVSSGLNSFQDEQNEPALIDKKQTSENDPCLQNLYQSCAGINASATSASQAIYDQPNLNVIDLPLPPTQSLQSLSYFSPTELPPNNEAFYLSSVCDTFNDQIPMDPSQLGLSEFYYTS